MKLRILGNKLRFRLTQNEVSELEKGITVSASVDFPLSESLIYSICPDTTAEEITASLMDYVIKISVPEKEFTNWTADDRVGIYHSENEGTDQFEIALEKDFQCLHKRQGEDEKDNYPNPIQEKD